MTDTSSTALLIVNLGTPEAPTPRAVRRYLAEFLHDHRVVQLTRWLWCPLLHFIILPLRSPRVARNYASVWMDDGSPLLVYGQRLARQMQHALPDVQVDQDGLRLSVLQSHIDPSQDGGLRNLTRGAVFLLYDLELDHRVLWHQALQRLALQSAGVLLLISRGSLEVLFGLGLNTGDLWMLVAVLTWSIYTVGLQWRPKGVHPMLQLAAFIFVGLLVMAPMYAWELSGGRTVNLHAGSVAGILYAGVIAAFLGFVCFNAGLVAVGPSVGSLFIHLQPVFAAILSTLLLGEYPAWFHYVGMTLVLGGIALTMRQAHS